MQPHAGGGNHVPRAGYVDQGNRRYRGRLSREPSMGGYGSKSPVRQPQPPPPSGNGFYPIHYDHGRNNRGNQGPSQNFQNDRPAGNNRGHHGNPNPQNQQVAQQAYHHQPQAHQQGYHQPQEQAVYHNEYPNMRGRPRGRGRQMPAAPIPPTGQEPFRYHQQAPQHQYNAIQWQPGYHVQQNNSYNNQDHFLPEQFNHPPPNYVGNQGHYYDEQPIHVPPPAHAYPAHGYQHQDQYEQEMQHQGYMHQQNHYQQGVMAVVPMPAPPNPVPLFVNPQFADQGPIQMWTNGDGYQEVYVPVDGQMNRIGYRSDHMLENAPIAIPREMEPQSSEEVVEEAVEEEEQEVVEEVVEPTSTVSGTISNFSLANATQGSNSSDSVNLAPETEEHVESEVELETQVQVQAEDEIKETPEICREIERWSFNGLNFPMVDKARLSEEEFKVYEDFKKSMDRHAKDFFKKNKGMWDVCDLTTRIVREEGRENIHSDYCWLDEEQKPVEDQKKKKKKEKAQLELEHFLPLERVVVPEEAFVLNKSTGLSLPTVYHKEVNVKGWTSMFDGKSPCKFTSEELFSMHEQLFRNQGPVIVMYSAFSRERSPRGNDIGEPDRPPIPHDDDEDQFEDAVEEAVPPAYLDNVVHVANDVEHSGEQPVTNSAGTTPSDEGYPRPSLNVSPSQARQAARSSRLEEFANGGGAGRNDLRSASNFDDVLPRRRRLLPDIPPEIQAAAAAEARLTYSSRHTPEQRAFHRQLLTQNVVNPRRLQARAVSEGRLYREEFNLQQRSWMSQFPGLRFRIPLSTAYAVINWPPYIVPMVGIARRDPGEPNPPLRFLPDIGNIDHFRMRYGDFDNREEVATSRGLGPLILSPQGFRRSAGESRTLREEFDEADRRMRIGAGLSSSSSGNSSGASSSSSQGN